MDDTAADDGRAANRRDRRHRGRDADEPDRATRPRAAELVLPSGAARGGLDRPAGAGRSARPRSGGFLEWLARALWARDHSVGMGDRQELVRRAFAALDSGDI